MATHPYWSDEYWLLLLQLYMKKPEGMKKPFDRRAVDLSLELHIPPLALHKLMFRLRQRDVPFINMLWNTYEGHPRKLENDARKLRAMQGFGRAKDFYEGVELNETFEKDFKPLPQRPRLKPVMLIMILDLYFRLTVNTMVPDTPEVQQLARLLRLTPEEVAEVLDVFCYCDPYLSRDELFLSPLLVPCQRIWNRYGNDNPEQLAVLAAQLTEYFK